MKCPNCRYDLGDIYEPFCPNCRGTLDTVTPQTEDILSQEPLTDEDAFASDPEPLPDAPSAGPGPSISPIDEEPLPISGTPPIDPAPVPLAPTPSPTAAPVSSVQQTQPAASPAGKCLRCGAPGDSICRDCSALPAPTLILEVEGYDPIRHRGKRVQRIPIVQDELLIGRRDAGQGIYPEIDLQDFQGQGYIGRKHAQIVRERGRHFLVHIHASEPTQYAAGSGQDLQPLATGDRRELQPGNRFVIGEAVAFRVLGPEGV